MRDLKVSLTIGYETIENIFVTALEGGSNYWYWLKDFDVDAVREATPSFNGSLSERICYAIMNCDVPVNVYDCEDEETLLGTLTVEGIEKNLQVFAAEYPQVLINLIDENYDAGDADIALQFMLMGTGVYG